MPLTAGTRLGNYEIVALLGVGGMGEVYRARDTRLGRDVALKVLPETLTASPDRLARFEREARTVASLNHPNIVVLHSIEEDAGTRFLTMELVEGQTLDTQVTPGGLPLSQALDLTIAIADALVAAHERGIVHRDLKPANVMVTREGRVKVLDFGLAKHTLTESDRVQIQEATVTAAVSGMGQVVGTVPYMAPEQIRGEPVDARSDLFSFGILAYELSTGRRPFLGQSPADVTSSILRDAQPSLTSLRADLPGDLERIVSRCLEKSPRQRAQSALDVSNELRRVASEVSKATAAKSGAPGSDHPSLVVLPFANVSADAENEYFSDGLTEEVIADLSRIESLRVISRTTAMRLKGTEKDFATLARELSVRYALEGSVRKAGNDLRIVVRLIDTNTDAPLWSEKYSGTLNDVFAIQEKVSRSIADSLRVRLTTKEDRNLSARPAPNTYAFDTYLRTRRDIWSSVPERMERAREELARAVEIVGDDPYLHVGLALVNWQYINSGISGDRSYLAEAERHARKVLALDPAGAEGPRLLGLICAQSGDIVGWLRHMQRAYEIDPHDSYGAAWVALGWTFAGHPDRARPIFEKLLSVDPLFDYLLFGMGLDAYYAGDYERGEDIFEQSRRLSPDHPAIPMVMAQIFASTGHVDRAVRVVEAQASPPGSHPLATLTHIFKHALLGDAAAADALATDEWAEKVWSDFQYTHMMAQAQAVLGRNDEALRWLRRANERGFIHYPFLAERDPLLARLRGDERFATQLAAVRVRWERLEHEVAALHDTPPSRQ